MPGLGLGWHQGRVIHSVGLAIQTGWNQLLGWHLFALGMSHDRSDDFNAHAIGELNGIGEDLAVLDRLLALGLSIKPDNLDLTYLSLPTSQENPSKAWSGIFHALFSCVDFRYL